MNQALLHNIDNALTEFYDHSLAEMNNSVLMDRVDSKFVVPAGLLPQLLHESKRDYSVLNVNGVNQSHYQNVYFDTNDLNFYHNHHNGKLNRIKVRHRHYVDTDTAFLEIKFKSNKQRTQKTRKQVSTDASRALLENEGFLAQHGVHQSACLKPSQIVGYKRICLVNEALEERITLDTGASFVNPVNGCKISLDDVVIIELKQRRINRQSPFYRLLRCLGVRSQSFSKYCAGISLTTEGGVKTNRFKGDINKVAKISKSIRTIQPGP